MEKKPIFIAEIKTKSMYGFESKYHRNTLIDTALHYGDWISCHTDPRFGGSFDDIYMLRKETDKPILAKGFHCHDDDIKKAFDLGADYVLVVQRLPNLMKFNNKKLLLELGDIIYERFDLMDVLRFVYNGRDLKTGLAKNIGDYHNFRKQCKWLCGASFIKEPRDVNIFYPNCDAFIVGQNLVEFCELLKEGKKY